MTRADTSAGPHAIGIEPRRVARGLGALPLHRPQGIRDSCALAWGRADTSAPGAATADAAHRVHRHFADALPLHLADEDESLEPRRRGCAHELDAALDRVSREQRAHAPLVARLCELTRALADDPARLAGLGAELSSLAQELERQLLDHLEQEEHAVIPAIAAHLAPDTRARIAAEFAAGRAPATLSMKEPGPVKEPEP